MVGQTATRFSACLLFSANALARATTAIGDAAFSRFGLSYSHAYLLSEVAVMPGATPSYLSQQLYLTPSTVTRLIEKLEQKGLVTRRPDGKNTLVYATEAGQALVPAITDAWQQNWDTFKGLLGDEEALKLTERVFKAADALSGKP
ncbi:MAG: winged helix-turn-helix transcriptional regulator [Bacteroidetes bacterium]|nr:winged helix-turn-helix transcriptional regulator [Fibrella sp.]